MLNEEGFLAAGGRSLSQAQWNFLAMSKEYDGEIWEIEWNIQKQ